MVCSECGKIIKGVPYGTLCQGCYHYFKNGGTRNPLPLKGEIKKDERGYVICHICGRAYKRLGSHIKESHNMTIAEYKELFGLCRRSRTTEDNYSTHMHDNAIRHDMPERLLKTGYGTRIKKGQTDMRKGKEVRLQEILDKRSRKRKSDTLGEMQ